MKVGNTYGSGFFAKIPGFRLKTVALVLTGILFAFFPTLGSTRPRPRPRPYRPGQLISPPQAQFSFSPAIIKTGETVNFTDISTGNPTSWRWYFGDGGSSNERNPQHVFSKPGNFGVILEVFNRGGRSVQIKRISVESLPDPIIVSPPDNETAPANYRVIDTGQTSCFNNSAPMEFPESEEDFFGQDAQYASNKASYNLSSDGKTVKDNNTDLTWMRGPNTSLSAPMAADKMTYDEAVSWVSEVNSQSYGGYNDWRIPTIKELYSLMNFNGTDPSSYNGNDTSPLTPFIDTDYFNFGYGDTSANERIIDSQYLSNNTFVLNPAELGCAKQFGLNLADGRIKGYDLEMPNPQGTTEKTFFVQLVRGSSYGINDFVNNGDGTITDRATGLMWAQDDSGQGMSWQEALSYVQEMNAQNHLGYSDWRLPDAKELHSIVNYENAPDYNDRPAIDTDFFYTSEIVNENGESDYPYFWTSTSHIGYTPFGQMSSSAVYIAFGRALGYSTRLGKWIDVHGAGAQRSDPKVAPPYSYATVYSVSKNGETFKGYAFGPQKDALRGLNYVRLVR